MRLIDAVCRETFRNPTKSKLSLVQGLRFDVLRSKLANAKRFVLDEGFSEMLAHLSSAPFVCAAERQPDVLDSLRHSAIPPFRLMWIEHDGHAFRRGLKGFDNVDYMGVLPEGTQLAPMKTKTDVYEKPLLDPSPEIVKDIGWLIELSSDQNLVKLTEFFFDQDGESPLCLPFTFTWSLDDKWFPDDPARYPNPRVFIDTVSGMFAHGVTGLQDRSIGVIYHIPLEEFPDHHKVDVVDEAATPRRIFKVHKLVVEFGGVVRYALAFLATLNNVPKIEVETRPQRGFIGKGQMRKYLDHTTLTLKLPQKVTMTRLAKRLIAQARRGWHEVRPHWRTNRYVLSGKYCARHDAHVWSAKDETGHSTCKHCDAKRVWITLPHGRGDPTISVRTHNYAVTRGEL